MQDDRLLLTRRWPLAIAGVAVLALMVALIGWHFIGRKDSRAYEGSDMQSLSEVSTHYGLKFPHCVNNTIRYGRYGSFSYTLYVYFTGDTPCVDEFLRLNQVDEERMVTMRGFLFAHYGEDLGWPQDTTTEYEYTTSDLRGQLTTFSLAIAVDRAANAVYLKVSSA